MKLRPVDIDVAQLSGARRRSRINGSGPAVNEFLLNPYRFGSGGGAVWPPAAGATSVLVDDPNYASCTALLHGNGTNGSTNFVDQIGSLWTASGNAQISTASPIYGSSNMLFDGAGDYISATLANALGTADFTIRCKIRIASLASDGEIFCIGAISNTSAFDLVLEYKTTGALRGSIQNGSGTANVDITTATSLLAINTTYDIAFVADGSTARLYIDGVQRQSGAITGTRVQALSSARVGHLATAVPRYFNGKMKGLQLYNGVCLYPSGTTFTPPANADRPSLPALTYISSFATSVTTVTDAQGVADDGTDLYYSNSTTLFKYSKAGSLITSRSTSGDAPTPRTQINGLFYRSGVLYVSAAYYSGGGTSYIAEYDPSTLTPLGVVHTLDISGLTNGFSEGLAWYGGFWWVVFHSDKKVGVYTSNFSSRVALLNLDFTITGSSGGFGTGQGYDGVAWWGDYMLCNIHETYNEKNLDVYFWNGATLSKVSRIVRTRSVESQGIALDPSDTTVLRLAERNYSGNDGIAKRQFV
jgi:hypothetical protein